VPGIITYQGCVTAHGTNFTGTGQFKFTIIRPALLNPTTVWSQDGKDTPVTVLSVPVTNGLFTVGLGDTSLPGMISPLTPAVFDTTNLHLRVWFSTDGGSFVQLAPDQRLTSTAYAMKAGTVSDGAITGAQIANGTVGSLELADGSVTTPKLANMAVTGPKVTNRLELGNTTLSGHLRLMNASSDLVGVVLDAGFASELMLYGPDGQQGALLNANNFGRLTLRDGPGDNITVDLNATDDNGGLLQLNNASGLQRATLLAGGPHDGGELQLRDSSGASRLRLYGNAPGYLIDTPSAGGMDVFDLAGARRIAMRGSDGTVHLPQVNGNEGVFLAGQALGGSGGILRLGQGDGHLGVLLRGDSGGAGLIDVASLNGFTRARLDGSSTNDSGEISVFDDNGTETIELLGASSADSGGQFIMRGNGGTTTVRLKAEHAANQGAELTMFNGSGDSTVILNADNLDNSGSMVLGSGTGHYGLFLDGGADNDGFGRIQVRNSAGNNTRVQIDGEGDGTGGQIQVHDASGTVTAKLSGAQTSTSGARLELSQANGTNTVILDGEVGNGGGGYLQLRNGSGVGTITLDSDFSGEGRITTQVLQITGGSDLSEQFDVRSAQDAPEPGMIVCIDPANPGELTVSTGAYDRAVAGVMSGAGGVKPGMLMGQVGSKADGKHPVALTGRVYCFVDADAGAVRPGDLITTSCTPGHGMKVTDHARAQGAIIGKAMTGLASGRGLVLVLVSLQ
jgi:hypothetical protein